MDWQALRSRHPVDRDMPERAGRLNALMAVRDNRLYDPIPHPFDEEFGGNGEYVPIRNRRPSVRSGLCRVVVDDAASLLFSEGHWPAIQAKTKDTVSALSGLIKAARLNETMLDAVTRGSVGSVVVWLRVLAGKPRFEVMDTANLTPKWAPDDPDRLVSVTERYKVKGSDLASLGYSITDLDLRADFWFQRLWDEQSEAWFAPLRVNSDELPQVDLSRSVIHDLGFCPMVWIRNLPGGIGPDGACTFEPAIDTVIEADYLLSQAGRGLNYSSDPKTVLIIEGETPPVIQGGATNALVLPKGGDAKLLEINGEAAKAVLGHVRELRAIALESIHGNRAPSERMASAQSGRAIELSWQGLIWLADRLRISYGEGALLSLLRMVCQASRVIQGGLTIGADDGVVLDPDGLELRWQDWMAPTPQDTLVTAQAVVTAYAGAVISQKTAVTRMASLLGVDDVTAEIALVEQAGAMKAQQALDVAAASKPDAADVRKDANDGPSETRTVTA